LIEITEKPVLTPTGETIYGILRRNSTSEITYASLQVGNSLKVKVISTNPTHPDKTGQIKGRFELKLVPS
jgi:hypothetical protein